MSKSDQRQAQVRAARRSVAKKASRRSAGRSAGRSVGAAATAASLSLTGLAMPGPAAAIDVTSLLRDIRPGAVGSFPFNVTTVGELVYFTADEPGGNTSLWRTDGTTAGTVMVGEELDPLELTAVGSTLFFTAIDDDVVGRELWKVDAATQDVVFVKDIDPTIYSGSNPTDLTAVGGTLYFSAEDAENGHEVWKSDGTAAGTVLVKDINPGTAFAGSPGYLTEVGGALFFTAADGVHGKELWKSDGTAAGTVLVEDLTASGGSLLTMLTAVGGTLFFRLHDGDDHSELWRSDGTAAGTVLLREFADIPIASVPGEYYPGLGDLTAAGATLFFGADDGSDGMELWKSDGTGAGTAQVEDVQPGAGSSDPDWLVPGGAGIFFTADDGVHGNELWTSDGSAVGTVQVADVTPGPAGSSFFGQGMVGATLFFGRGSNEDRDLWRSNGTAAGTVLVKNFASKPGGQGGVQNRFFRTAGSSLVFQADDGVHGVELWQFSSNGVPTDTTPPNTTITAGAAAGATITNTSATFSFAGTAGETSKLQCSLDRAAFTACTSPKTFTGLKNGAHEVRFRAVDAAGNVDPSPAARSFTVASNAFTLPTNGTANYGKGTLTLLVRLPGPGRLVLSRSGISPVRRVAITATAAGATKIKITLTKAGLARLKKKRATAQRDGKRFGSMKVAVKVAYTPTAGLTRTKTATYTLKLT